jgi:hypothetical protein
VVAWQKTLHKRTLKYEVYRETGEADDFGYKIGERYFNQKSFVVDTTARFAEKSYRYRLTTIDSTCFNEAVSRVHKTIHLQTFLTQDNGVGLRWNPYQGLPIRSYLVYRIEPDGTSREIKRIARDSIVMTFTDYSPGNSVARYRVGYILPKTIYIDSLLKSDSGPYSLSLSNLAESKIALDVPVQQDDDVSILPNPASTYVTISIKDIPARMVTIVNRLGEVVTRFDVSRDVNSLLLVDVSLFSSGVYTIVIESDKQSVARKLIVE